MGDFRLGDVLDDYCIKCRRLTNHSIVSIINEEPAKVRCRTCYHDHDYRHEIAPPTKKELKQAELMAAMLAAAANGESPEAVGLEGEIEGEEGVEAELAGLHEEHEEAPAAEPALEEAAPAPKKATRKK